MSKTIAILAQGAMGAAVARRLTDNGATVITCLEGRGAASRARAEAAGMIDGPLDRFATADLFLSIVPPDAAHVTAQDVLPHLVADGKHVPYVDCNAVSPATVRRIARLAEAQGSAFIDASIIGPPPIPGATSTVFYASGETLDPMLELGRYGLDVRPLDAGVGAASALKMCYAGIAKGLTGLGAAMILAATREGAAEALMAEMERSQPEILGLLRPRVPDMLPKAYCWAGEMEEIAAFVGAGEAATI
jgi:putative dehydrogenase